MNNQILLKLGSRMEDYVFNMTKKKNNFQTVIF